MRILVTGMSGLIGKAVRIELEPDYDLRALNRNSVEGIECVRADISNIEDIRPAFEGVDQVVHMAAIAHGSPNWNQLLPFNVIGTYNVFEAAREAGVKRIIYASSGSTISGYEGQEPYKALSEGRYEDAGEWDDITHLSPLHPKGIYGCTKVWAEALARHYSDAYGISMIGLRIGAVNEEDKPLQTRQRSVFCSRGDVARMVRTCIEASDDIRYDIFFVTSNNQYGYRDMSHAKAVLGFEPQDTADR